jgi:hypothetical protein
VAWWGEERGKWGAYLALNEVTDARLGHDGDGDSSHDLLDHLRVGHACHASLDADISRDALEGHDGAGAGLLGDAGLCCVDDVHDHAALQHTGQAGLDGEGVGGGAIGAVGGGGAEDGEFSCHCCVCVCVCMYRGLF